MNRSNAFALIQRVDRKPWLIVQAVDVRNKEVTLKFLLKESLEQLPYILMVTDCHRIWSQVSSEEEFRNQVQEILPGSADSSQSEQLLLDVVREKLLETQTSSVIQSNKAHFSAELNDDRLVLSLDVVFSDVSFIWTFRCIEWKQECQLVLSELLVYPLLNTLKLLNDEKYVLVDIISRKDKEISEYKSFFGTLPKVSVSTQPFSLEKFDSSHIMEQNVSDSTNDFWTQHLSDLFASVVSLDEEAKQKMSLMLGPRNNETFDSVDIDVQNKRKVETNRGSEWSTENVVIKDSCNDETSNDYVSDEHIHTTDLRTRSKLLEAMSSTENVGKKVQKRKRLF